MIGDSIRRRLLPPDTTARHAAIAEMLPGQIETLLDVGGNRRELSLFTPDLKVTSINLAGEDSDLTYDGRHLPFGEGSFDAVVSLDVLEHIPSPGREGHVRELLRVSQTEVLVCCPLGTSAHVMAEREVAEAYENLTGNRHRFLDEHLDLGLPTLDEVQAIAEGTGCHFKLFFQGDFRLVNRLFLDGVRLKAQPGLRIALRFLSSRRQAAENSSLQESPSESSNRIFLKLSKG